MDLSITKIKQKIMDIIKKEQYKKLIIFLGLFGVLLIFISNSLKSSEKSYYKNDYKSEEKTDSDRYIKRLESNLESIVSSIKGAGKTKILITLSNGSEIVYATEEKNNKEASEDKSNGEITRKKQSNDIEKRYITIKDSDGTEKALAVTEIQPIIKGVAVVCEGGDNAAVQKRIIDAITTVLNITTKQVCVTKLE